MAKQKPGLVEGAPEQEITYKIIGAAMKVHNDLGPGHQEVVYQRALALEFSKEPWRLSFVEECELPVFNEDGQLVYVYRSDFLVEESVIAELKAQSHPLTQDNVAQVLDYFAASTCPVALLFNFGRPRLEWRRLFPPKHIQEMPGQRMCNG